MSHPTGWRVGLLLVVMTRVAMLPVQARTQCRQIRERQDFKSPFAELFDIARSFLSEQTRSHASSHLLHLSGILLTIQFSYVSISRASYEVTIFIDDLAKLSPRLRTDISKPPLCRSV